MTYYWKVLREEPYKECSRLLSLFDKGRLTEYSRTERTYPEKGCGPLTILRTRKAAEHLFFHLRYKDDKVLAKVTAKISKHKKVWDGPSAYRTVEELESANSDILLPGHTLLADWVKIVKIVQRKEVSMHPK
uniref:Uncharacterized protein n=1 Tax=viral metagenome TaxID=1070528 RepID=A0A6M3KX54_9ZZZZ